MEEKLTNGELSSEIQKLLARADGDIPQDVTNQILSLMIQDTGRNIKRLRGETKESLDVTKKEIQESLNGMEERILNNIACLSGMVETNVKNIKKLEEESKVYPSIFKWVRTNKYKAWASLVGFFIISQLWFISGFRFIVLSSILHIAGKVFGLPDETIDQILLLLFV